MEQPPGYAGIRDHSKVCRPRRAIYGLKQSPRAWFTKFSELIRCQGFSAREVEPIIFQRSTTSRCVALTVYVDDMLITGNDLAGIEITKKFLHAHLDIRDLGTPKYFLGIEFASRSGKVVLNQRKYVLDILQDMGLPGCKPHSSPIESHPNF